jgi:hypothetical protein
MFSSCRVGRAHTRGRGRALGAVAAAMSLAAPSGAAPDRRGRVWLLCPNPGTRQHARDVNGSAVPANNHVASAYTSNNPGVDAVEFETENPVPLLSSTSRFITFSVNAAAIDCAAPGGGPPGSPGAPRRFSS